MLLPRHVRQHGAHEVHAAPLPGRPQNLGDRPLQALGVRDHQLDVLQAPPPKVS